ncbi:hypothetical protein GYMLUDRAFT_247029 [Collybiopsis luxurians FD-317 M1]|uniref:Uncharacterized protein n=1 Tax=Collybiopsis luxurians FD-317 M1 TaxID=944289 RepID=A0A0D0CGQ9_9AGAR|nr:hypothetical protein GYMLUDRAFT_247029 [Collybiopsis luxurians FD-317 M1]
MATSILLSDFIVIWRAWTLFWEEKHWKVALALLMIVNIGTSIADCILDDIDLKVEESDSSISLDWTSGVVSLLVNMFGTGLIAQSCHGSVHEHEPGEPSPNLNWTSDSGPVQGNPWTEPPGAVQGSAGL